MSKTCAQLFEGIPATILGDANTQVEGLAYDSRDVRSGDAFFCIVGLNVDGHTFAQNAIDAGAKVLVVERKLYLADTSDVVEVVVADTRRAMALAACAFFDHPSSDMAVVGVTGTNGKTTTTHLIEHIAHSAGVKSGFIGTVGTRIGSVEVESPHTTPESVDLQRLLAQMRDEGCKIVAIEVSSHALDMMRVLGTRFCVTAFTNLTQDHLDYHHTLENYFEAKRELFTETYPAKRVISVAGAWGQKLAALCKEAGDEVIEVGFDESCDIHPIQMESSITETALTLSVLGQTASVDFPLLGSFNVENGMVALACALECGIPLGDAVRALSSAKAVPGRLERIRVRDDGGVSVYVDYAHTPDALAQVIATLHPLVSGRLILVFGCEGDRDKLKRPLMGAEAMKADVVYLTNDNRHGEDMFEIIEQTAAAMREISEDFTIEPDRKRAIRRAIDEAKSGDVVLITGRGHEDLMMFGPDTVHFDDREEAAYALCMKAECAR